MKKLIGILAVALLATCIVASHLWLQLRDARDQLAALPPRAESPQPAPQPPLVAAAETGIANAATAPSSAPQPPTAPSPAPPTASKQATAALVASLKQLNANPEYLEMQRSSARARLPQTYPDIAKDLGITPELANRLFDVMARQQSEPPDMDALAMVESGSWDRAAMQEMQRKELQKEQDREAERAAVLGDKYAEWRDYEATPSARNEVNELRVSLGSGADALGDIQVKALITTLAAEKGRIDRETFNASLSAEMPATMPTADIEQEFQRRADQDLRLIKSASSVLSGQQLDAYKQMLEKKRNMARTVLQSLREQQKAGQKDPTAGLVQ